MPILALLALPACGSKSDADSDAGDTPDGGTLQDGSPLPDAEIDDPCDYVESNDADNDVDFGGTAEPTGIDFGVGSGQKVICGRIDPANVIENDSADADFYEFTVSGQDGDQIPFRVVLASPEGDTLEDFAVIVQFVPEGGSAINIAGGTFEDGYGLATNQFFIPGTFRVFVIASDTPLPSAPVDYEVRIAEAPPCQAATGTPDYVEANDGEDSRGNDVITLIFNMLLGLTPSEDDAPEQTGISLSANTTVHLSGQSADVGSDGDEYLDRDTFQVGVAAPVNEVDIRLSWIGEDVDMDLMAFRENMVSPAAELSGFSGLSGGNDDEIITIRASAGTNLWIWAATFDDEPGNLPATYDITICPRTFIP